MITRVHFVLALHHSIICTDRAIISRHNRLWNNTVAVAKVDLWQGTKNAAAFATETAPLWKRIAHISINTSVIWRIDWRIFLEHGLVYIWFTCRPVSGGKFGIRTVWHVIWKWNVAKQPCHEVSLFSSTGVDCIEGAPIPTSHGSKWLHITYR